MTTRPAKPIARADYARTVGKLLRRALSGLGSRALADEVTLWLSQHGQSLKPTPLDGEKATDLLYSARNVAEQYAETFNLNRSEYTYDYNLFAGLARRQDGYDYAPLAPPPPPPHKHASAPRGAQLPLFANRVRRNARRPNPGPTTQPQPRPVTRAALAALFVRCRANVARQYPRVAAASLVLVDAYASPGSPGGYRDLAWCDPRARGGPCVYLCARALTLGTHVCEGLVLHELGHCADPRVAHPGREQRADDVAERATGRRVYYDRHNVQTTNPRGATWPRPRHLHR